MLILTRRPGEVIKVIKDNRIILSLTHLGTIGKQCRFGFDADDDLIIHRSELLDRIISNSEIISLNRKKIEEIISFEKTENS